MRRLHLRQPSQNGSTAIGKHALALLATLDIHCHSVEQLSDAAADAFWQHPDYAIITSSPGLADNIGARVLAELGDDRARFTDARAVKAYAAQLQSPVHPVDRSRSTIGG